MVNVAIAGGSGVVGKTLAEKLTRQTKHNGFILTRKAHTSCNQSALPLIEVDYSNVPALAKPLDENDIQVVISALGIKSGSLEVSQAKLIKAADAASSTKRFIPTSFAISGVKILPPLQAWFDSLDLLRTTSLEWATVNNGIFLDYFASPTLPTHLSGALVLDIANNAAAIPGTGEEPVTFTYTHDVAKFVVAALDLAQWPACHELTIIGDTMTFNQFVALAEIARGVKFEVVYDDLDKLKRFEVTELPAHKEQYDKWPKERLLPFLSIFERWMAEGECVVEREGSLNELFPAIESLTIKTLLNAYWHAQ